MIPKENIFFEEHIKCFCGGYLKMIGDYRLLIDSALIHDGAIPKDKIKKYRVFRKQCNKCNKIIFNLLDNKTKNML